MCSAIKKIFIFIGRSGDKTWMCIGRPDILFLQIYSFYSLKLQK
ncbi:hypothetical protein M138_0662 [Bacteroides fragilis str. S23L17]|nr:hypothetical protein M146_0788 [Bacteroides fragilis str. 1007-1-F \